MPSIITFLLVLIVLSILILIHEFGHFLVAKRTGVKVEVFSLGFGRKLVGFKRKGTEYCISAVPLGGYVKMAGEMPYEEGLTGAKWEFMSKPISIRTLIIAAGPILNYLLGFVVFAMIFAFGNPETTSKIGGVMDDYPAVAAGLTEGDRIIQIDGRRVSKWGEVLEAVHKKTEGYVELKIERDSRVISCRITPKVKEMKNVFGQKIKIGQIGIIPSSEIVYMKYPLIKAGYMSAQRVWDLTRMTYIALWRIATGAMSFRESVTGPIGIFVVTSQAARMGIAYLLGLVGVLSVCLAIFNLLPIPVLDGGHILFLIIEKLRGRILNAIIYERMTQIGMAVLVMLMIFVFYNDFVRFGLMDKTIKGLQKIQHSLDAAK